MPATRSSKARERAASDTTCMGTTIVDAGERRAFGDVSNNRIRSNADGKKSGNTKPRVTRRAAGSQREGVLVQLHTEVDEVPQTRGVRHKSDPAEMGTDHQTGRTTRSKKMPTKTRAQLKDDGGGLANSRQTVATATGTGKRKNDSDDQSKPKRAKATDDMLPLVQPQILTRNAKAKRAAKSRDGINLQKLLRKTNPMRDLCNDFYTVSSFTLNQEGFDASKYTFGIAAVDKRHVGNVLRVTQYATDIYQRLFSAELKYMPHKYMHKQSEINEAMRAILIDWLVEVHMKFRLAPETLYLCINLIDRYLSETPVKRRILQLVGVTCLLLACKYEEIYPPEVRDCVYISDRAYTRQEVLDMEQAIVKQLGFKMTVPTAYPFLSRFLHLMNASVRTKHAANYYLERTLQEYKFISMRPSLIALAAVCLALNNEEIRDLDDVLMDFTGIPPTLLEYTGFLKTDVINCANQIIPLLGEEVVTASNRKLEAVTKKFTQSKYYEVALVMEPDTSGW